MGFCVDNRQICGDTLEVCGIACPPHLRLDGLEQTPAPSPMGCFYRLFISKYIGTAQTVDLAWAIPTHTKPHRPEIIARTRTQALKATAKAHAER
jgi:hypothetical protein